MSTTKPTQEHWFFKDRVFSDIWRQIQPFTMTSPERGYALYQAVHYVIRNRIHGDFVECGVWRGGSAMLMALTLKSLDITHRNIVLFDTFSGMTPAGPEDTDVYGRAATDLLDETYDNRDKALIWAQASLDEVKANLEHCGYDPRRIRFVQGDVTKTLSQTQTGDIALLRLDTDFYDSTLAEMEQLYPRVSQYGVVILDDYGHWRGCKRAVDSYFSQQEISPLLHAIDYTGRSFIKPTTPSQTSIERYDYRPKGMADPNLLDIFPSLKICDPKTVNWPYLRYRAPHTFRVDARHAGNLIGVLSYEEAMILHNAARMFAGSRALEIGCHLAWSSAHILSAGVQLDIIDPALAQPIHRQHVIDSLDSVPSKESYTLWAGFSPDIVSCVYAQNNKTPWSLIFIDGNHDGDAPEKDAMAVLPYCADDAMILFHDLTSPDVARGLAVLKQSGWHTRIYNTMQIMGVAWRGNTSPPTHIADPNVPLALLPHLSDWTHF